MSNEKDKFQWLPKQFLVLGKMMLISFVLLFVLRVVFLIYHWNTFHQANAQDWLGGAYFDLMTVCIVYLPFALIHLLPLPIHRYRPYRIFANFYFLLANILIIIVNLIDLEYFSYTAKRTTYDVVAILTAGQDFNQLIGPFFFEFWWILIILAIFISILQMAYGRWIANNALDMQFSLPKQLVTLVFWGSFIVVMGRGGTQLKPKGIIEANAYCQSGYSSFVLNTAFTMIKSFGDVGLTKKDYFPEEELDHLFNPIQTSEPQHIFDGKQNLVLIILESFGNEWFAPNNPNLKVSYTPFLDSLIQQGLFFSNGFANGKKSIEAVPSIIASLPSLMNTPYITSQYGGNTIESLPTILRKQGYTSAFYHGATNGSMRFDSFAKTVGYDHYFGRNEYGNDDHFDQTWGIMDEYFNPWSARKMSELKEPFFGTLFTLSSHHPYHVPKNRLKDIVVGDHPIATAISYGDYSLRKFFEEAKQQPWYDQTLFVICADHTPAATTKEFFGRNELYRIPILFYHPGKKLKPQKKDRIFQQIDILPTALDLLDIETKFYGFGHSYFSKAEPYSIAFLEGVYYYFCGQFMVELTGDNEVTVADLQLGRNLTPQEMKARKKEIDPKIETLKALIQRYNQDLISNQTHIE